jgi:hypothetical protein
VAGRKVCAAIGEIDYSAASGAAFPDVEARAEWRMGGQEAVYPGIKRLFAQFGGAAARKPIPPHERTCIVHAGGHKTGTSSLQAFLALNRKRLLKRGYLVPNVGHINGEHHRLIFSLAGAPIAPRHASYGDDLAEELRRHDHDHVIISSERLETLFRSEAAFWEVMRRFSSLGYRIRLVYYVRNTPQLLNSRYNQVVRSYGMDDRFSTFVERNTARGSPTDRLLKLSSDQTIEWIIRPYDAHVRAEGIERDFLDCIGLGDFRQSASAVRSNESIGPVAVEAARRSMKELKAEDVQLTRHQRGLCSRELIAAVTAAAIKEPAYCGLTTQLVRTIETAQQARNDEFAQQVWGRSWTEVFGADIGRDYVSNDLDDIRPSAAQQEALDAMMEVLRPRLRDVVAHGPRHET